MGMCDYFLDFAEYNAWANQLVYSAAATLEKEDYQKDRGAFFGSLHGTLNHLLVADRIWMWRFTLEGTPPKALDQILYDDLGSLYEARRWEDERIERYIAALDETRLEQRFTYRLMSGAENTQPLKMALAHFFNHQTHHRGQAHCLLTQAGKEVPPLDLVVFLRQRQRT